MQVSIEGVLSIYPVKVSVLGHPESMSNIFTVSIFATDISVTSIFAVIKSDYWDNFIIKDKTTGWQFGFISPLTHYPHFYTFRLSYSFLMLHYVLFNVPLIFIIILSFMAKLSYCKLVIWWKCLLKRCLWKRSLLWLYLEPLGSMLLQDVC